MRKATQIVTVLALLGLVSCQSAPAPDKAQGSGKGSSLMEKLRAPKELDIPAGATLSVRLDQALDTERNKAGDTFTATLDEPVLLEGKVAVPKGTSFNGHVTSAKPSGRLKGRGYLVVRLDSFELNGDTYRIDTDSHGRSTGSHKKRNALLIGGGTGVGALIGGLAGGGMGAAIGAGAGAGAGTAGAAFSGKKNVAVPAETLLRFTLKAPIRVKA